MPGCALRSHPRCQTTRWARLGPPDQAGWLRLQVRRDGHVVRLFTRRGYDWSGRYPAIVLAAMRLRRARSFTLDGEAVVCGPDGVAIFDALHRRNCTTTIEKHFDAVLRGIYPT